MLLAIALGVGAAYGQLGGDVQYTPIAISGDAAPGLGGATFAGFADARIAPDGGVVFWARAAGGSVTEDNDEGVWQWNAGSLSLRLREGAAAPWDGEPSPLVAVPAPAVAAGGTLSLHGAVADLNFPFPDDAEVPARNSGLFQVDPSGNLDQIVRQGIAIDGLPMDGIVGNLTAPVQHRGGPMAVSLSLDASTNPFGDAIDGFGIWTQGPDGLTARFVRDDALTTLGGDALTTIDRPALTGAGDLSFRTATSAGSNAVQDFALISDRSGEPVAIARTGDPAPGADGTFVDFSRQPRIDGGGRMAFRARVEDGSGETRTGIWSELGGSLEAVAIEGEPAPVSPAANFGRLSDAITANDRGELAFRTRLREPGSDNLSGQALLTDVLSGALHAIARTGDQVPDQDGDVRIRGIGRPVLDAHGQLIFGAWLEGDGVSMETNRALLAADELGNLRSILREGQMLDVAGDGSDVRRVERFEFVPREAWSGASPIGDRRRLALHVGFQGATLQDESSSVVVIELPSPIDFDGSGSITSNDFLEFLSALANGEAEADLDRDGDQDTDDFQLFLDVFAR